MGASQSRKDGSSVYDDGSWHTRNLFSTARTNVKLSDPTEKTPRDISGPLGPVALYPNEANSEFNGHYNPPVSIQATEKSKTTLKTKVFEAVGRAGTAGLGKAVGALDTIGSSMTSLNKASGFTSSAIVKPNRIEILAFEVANTIAKAYGLKVSLSKDSIKHLKEEVLCSYGVQRLVSSDMSKLLSIAAADKRKELAVFANEVVRFGNQCRDCQWHHLDRYFNKLDTQKFVPKQNRDEIDEEVQTLLTWAQQTGELYHELNSLDRFEAEMRRKLQDEDLYDNYSRGDNLSTLRSEQKARGKAVKMLKKKSLWSKTLEEVMEKLVDAVYFLHSEIERIFGDAGKILEKSDPSSKDDRERLGVVGLALHYACIISQIDALVSRAASIPVDARDSLYQSLPTTIKAALKNKILLYDMSNNKLDASNLSDEMEKTLSWLVPMANNTTKTHQGFGWVGEWANTGSSLDLSLSARSQISLIQTLHHADKAATEECILDLLVQLHYLVIAVRENVATLHPSASIALHSNSTHLSGVPYEMESMQYNNSDIESTMMSSTQARPELERLPSREEPTPFLTKSDSHPSSRPLEDELSSSSLNHGHDARLDRVKSLDIMDRVDDI
ncbi:hypothetical protein KP509_05G002200 [Ceratopteris richardii]|uniref:Uncharacterized protein n=1 Tax=Ceratopteris richardii TaxID=49495 RepID=A0A8T2UQE1_CERRI|nr:hypothetical protein KP509_05G002200 [Ceratopteris richardii]